MHARHGRRVADQHRWSLGGLHAALQGQVLVLQDALLSDFLQDGLDFDQLARLGDVIERPQAHGLNGRFHAGMAGHDQGFRVGSDLPELLEDLDAGHARHAQIENGDVERALFQDLESGPAVRAEVTSDPRCRPGCFPRAA